MTELINAARSKPDRATAAASICRIQRPSTPVQMIPSKQETAANDGPGENGFNQATATTNAPAATGSIAEPHGDSAIVGRSCAPLENSISYRDIAGVSCTPLPTGNDALQRDRTSTHVCSSKNAQALSAQYLASSCRPFIDSALSIFS